MSVRQKQSWLQNPWLLVLLGILVSAVGVVLIHIWPERDSGFTPVVALQGSFVIGGIVAMYVGVYVSSGVCFGQALRVVTRGAIAFGSVFALLMWLDVPFGTLIAVVTTSYLSERLRVLCAWLGRKDH